MFGLGKKKPQMNRGLALAAKPCVVVHAVLQENDSGGARIRVPLRASSGLARWLPIPANAAKTFELDSVGLFVWRLCDGHNSVQQIIRRLSREHNLTLRETEVATVHFLQTLVKKGLIGLKVRENRKDDR